MSLEQFENQVASAELPTPVDAAKLINEAPREPDQIFTDMFDVGDKIAIIGSSKVRKTFFLLQLLMCLAAGMNFLVWQVRRARRIFHVQFEIQEHHFHRRVWNMARAIRIDAGDLGGRLQILNARGLGITGTDGIKRIGEISKPHRPEVISLDPLYKIATGTENDSRDMKEILDTFDELSLNTGAAIPFVHHDAKGSSGDRDIRDRGAGSNVLGRDYDACITLTPHATERNAIVVETLLRNYPPQEPFTALWTDGHFEVRQAIAAIKRTSKRCAGDNPGIETYLPAALDLLRDGPMNITLFMDQLRAKAALTHERSKAFRSWATAGSDSPLEEQHKRGRGRNTAVIGTREQIIRCREENG